MTGPTKDARRAVATRDEGRCVVCGVFVVDADTMRHWVNWSMQHRVARGMGGSKTAWINDPVNLLTICGDGTSGCHGRVETERAWGRQCGFAVPQWRHPVDVPVKHWLHSWAWLTPTGWVPLTTAELWLQAAEWLADETRIRGVADDPDGMVSLSTAATEFFGLKAKDAA